MAGGCSESQQSQVVEEEEENKYRRMGRYGGKVRVLREGEEGAAEETMLLWGLQQPTLSKPNAFVSHSSLRLRLDACGHSLSILQSPSSLSTPGVTGSVMWDSGVVLGKLLEHAVDSNLLFLRGKKVIELGSGCGLVGCIAALLGAQVILTDLPDRLRLLKKNIKANLSHVDGGGSASVKELIWGDEPDQDLIEPLPDFVLGSDVIYSEAVVVDLLDTMKQLSGTQTTIFLSGELRNAKNSTKQVMSSSAAKHPQVITCKAAVAWGAGEALVIEEVQVSPPLPQEIRIKVVCTSLCRSDLAALDSQAIFPRVFGHEASGIVESFGAGVTEFEEGDHVLTVFTGECKTCRQCTSGKSNICQVLGLERKGVMHIDHKTRFSIKGKPVYHYCAVSSFSEYTVVHSGCAVKVSSVAPLEKICLLSCGVAAGLGAAWNVANISKGSTVAIFGLGTVGLSVAQGAKARGASQIIGVDTNPEKFEKAKALGVTDFINPDDCSEPIQQVIKHITNGGADYSFECIGDTGAITTALQSCCDGWGLTVTLGVPKVKPEVFAHYSLFLTGRTLKGSLLGGWKPKSDIPFLVDLYMKKEIEIDDLITHNLPFEDINKAFNLMREGKCVRCVIHMP